MTAIERKWKLQKKQKRFADLHRRHEETIISLLAPFGLAAGYRSLTEPTKKWLRECCFGGPDFRLDPSIAHDNGIDTMAKRLTTSPISTSSGRRISASNLNVYAWIEDWSR